MVVGGHKPTKRNPGAATLCLQRAWDTLFKWGRTEAGRGRIASAMRLCDNSAPKSTEDVDALADWASSAWDYMVGRQLSCCSACCAVECVACVCWSAGCPATGWP